MQRLRDKSHGIHKIPIDMTPMIDAVFQLIIFFMLTLKIRTDEGNFDINMPIGAPAQASSQLLVPDIKVRLIANRAGGLGRLELGRRSLGNGDQAYAALNDSILGIVGKGGALNKEVEVEIDADYELHYQEVIKAITACTGRINPATKQPERFVEKIKFAPPRKPVAEQ